MFDNDVAPHPTICSAHYQQPSECTAMRKHIGIPSACTAPTVWVSSCCGSRWEAWFDIWFWFLILSKPPSNDGQSLTSSGARAKHNNPSVNNMPIVRHTYTCVSAPDPHRPTGIVWVRDVKETDMSEDLRWFAKTILEPGDEDPVLQRPKVQEFGACCGADFLRISNYAVHKHLKIHNA